MKLLNKLAIFCCVAALAAAPVIHVTAQAADSAEKPKAEQAKKAKKPRIELNNATVAQLKTLKGVDDDIARQIIQNRPFRSVSELVSKKIIPSRDALREMQKEADIVIGEYKEPQNKKKQNNNKNKGGGGGKNRRK